MQLAMLNRLYPRFTWAAIVACLVVMLFNFVGTGKDSSGIVWLSRSYDLEAEGHFECQHHNYSIEILSIDPFIMYINDFLSQAEILHILRFSRHYEKNEKLVSDLETSFNERAPRFPSQDPLNVCLSQRMKSILGNVQHIETEPIRVVKYARDDKIQVHYDWFPLIRSETGLPHMPMRPNNRLGSIFAYVEDDCDGGETYFPDVNGVPENANSAKFSISENDKGLLVKPYRGNAVFWNNLYPNGSGDIRTAHAGMPVTRGTKIGINLWSYYFLDAPILG